MIYAFVGNVLDNSDIDDFDLVLDTSAERTPATLPGSPTVTAAAPTTYLRHRKLRWSLRPSRFALVSSIINLFIEDNKHEDFFEEHRR